MRGLPQCPREVGTESNFMGFDLFWGFGHWDTVLHVLHSLSSETQLEFCLLDIPLRRLFQCGLSFLSIDAMGPCFLYCVGFADFLGDHWVPGTSQRWYLSPCIQEHSTCSGDSFPWLTDWVSCVGHVPTNTVWEGHLNNENSCQPLDHLLGTHAYSVLLILEEEHSTGGNLGKSLLRQEKVWACGKSIQPLLIQPRDPRLEWRSFP